MMFSLTSPLKSLKDIPVPLRTITDWRDCRALHAYKTTSAGRQHHRQCED